MLYQVHSTTLADVLANYGATSDDTSGRVSVPFSIQLGNTTYTATYNFSYKAKADKFGMGK